MRQRLYDYLLARPTGATPDELAALIARGWTERTDRGAEERLSARDRGPLMQIGALKQDPHLEMHTRGG